MFKGRKLSAYRAYGRAKSVEMNVLIGECHIETEVTKNMGRMEGDEARALEVWFREHRTWNSC